MENRLTDLASIEEPGNGLEQSIYVFGGFES